MTVRLRLVQRGASDEAPIVLAYLVGSHLDGAMRDALPGVGIVATAESGLATSSSIVEQARILAGCGKGSPLVLVGYSAGCQGVRRHLLDGLTPSAVVAIDGTHGSMPPAEWQVDVWRQAIDRARKGEALFVGTCTQQRYTERLGLGKAFASTRTILEAASGASLDAGSITRDGDCHLLGYASKDIDGPAHIHQQREVLPMVLREHVAPRLAREPLAARWLSSVAAAWGSVLERIGRTVAPQPEPLSLGLAALELARTQLGVSERSGKNDGPAVAAYFEACTRRTNGKEAPTGWATGWDWCAAFASWCGHRAAGDGQPPHGRRIAVWELVRDAREAGAWEDVADWGAGPRPGDLVIWRRSGDPRTTGQTGHVSRCVSWDGKRLVTIGGNEENRVREADVSADLARAVGVIRYP